MPFADLQITFANGKCLLLTCKSKMSFCKCQMPSSGGDNTVVAWRQVFEITGITGCGTVDSSSCVRRLSKNQPPRAEADVLSENRGSRGASSRIISLKPKIRASGRFSIYSRV